MNLAVQEFSAKLVSIARLYVVKIVYSIFYVFLECQADYVDSSVIANLQNEVAALRSALLSRPEFSVETLLKGNDKILHRASNL